MDELLDHGPEPEHPRHLEHQCPVQPAPGHRRHLPSRQRPLLPHRPAQCHGRPRNGLHGPRPARPALVAGGSRPPLHRGYVEAAPWQPAPGWRQRHDGHVRGHGQGQHQGLLDHLHQPGCDGAEPPPGDRRPAGRRAGDHPGRLPRHRNQPLRRHPPARRSLGRSRRRDDQLRAQPDPDPQSGGRPRRQPAGLADHRPRRLRHGLCRGLRLRLGGRSLRRDQAGVESRDRL
ncbi:hypothetical protein D3C85_1129590 [compost metagenome]